MSQIIPQFDPSVASNNQSFSARLVNGGWLMLINESAIGLQLLFSSGAKKLVPAFSLRVMKMDPNLDNVQWTVAYTIPGGAPVSLVTGEALEPTEWTAGEVLLNLTRLTNIGNSVPVSTSTNQVINDGNVAGTQVLEATPSGGGGSQAIITNEGAATLGGGNLQISTSGALSGAASLSSDGGVFHTDGAGNSFAAKYNGPIHGNFGNSSWNGQSFPGGTGSGTFSHALGTTPNWAGPTCNTVNSSQTMGYDTLTSTTLHVTAGAGLSWLAMVVKAS